MNASTHVVTISPQTKRIDVAAKDPVVLPAIKQQSCCLWFGRKIYEAAPRCLAEPIMRCLSPCCSIKDSIALEQAISAKWDAIPLPVQNIIYSYSDIDSIVAAYITTLYSSFSVDPQQVSLLQFFKRNITCLDFHGINLNTNPIDMDEEIFLRRPYEKIQKAGEHFPALKILKLAKSGIGYMNAKQCADACFQALVKGCQNLEYLDLSYNEFAGTSLHHLSKLRCLKTLTLIGCVNVTAEDKQGLIKLHAERQIALLEYQKEHLKDKTQSPQKETAKRQLPPSPTSLTIIDKKSQLADLQRELQALSLESPTDEPYLIPI
jgi:hypothetical protein